MTYKLIKDRDGIENSVLRSDGWSIPFNEQNSDYQAYLKWLELGNQPLPADK